MQQSLLRLPYDLIQSRELLFDLVSKDLRVRYRYAVLGFLWAIIEPIALMAVLGFIFSFVFAGRLPQDQQAAAPPYAISLLCGIIFWQLTATALSSATQSLIDNQNLVKKVCFAREIIPIAATGYPLVNFAIGFLILLLFHLVSGGAIGLSCLFFIPLFLIHFVLILGLALLFSCANVYFRDIGYMVSVALLFGFYASPVFYPLEFLTQAPQLPPWLQDYYPWIIRAYLLNPMAELLTAYRQILFEQRFPDCWLLAWPTVSAILALVAGTFTFRKFGPNLADRL